MCRKCERMIGVGVFHVAVTGLNRRPEAVSLELFFRAD